MTVDDALPAPMRAGRPRGIEAPVMPAPAIWIALALGAALVLAILPLALGIAAAVLVVAFVAAFTRPAAGVAILLLSVPVQDSLPVQVGSVEVTWTRWLLLAVVAASLGGAAVRPDRRIRTPVLTLPFALFIGGLVLSIGNAGDVSNWAAEVYRWGVAFVAYLLAATALRQRRDIALVLAGLALGIAGSGLVAAYQVIAGVGPASFSQRGVTRVYAAFGEPNPFAGYLEMAVLPLCAFALVGHGGLGLLQHRFARVAVLWAPLGIGIAALLLTQSRGGLLGFMAGGAVIVWHAWRRVGPPLVAGAAIVALLIGFGPFGGGLRQSVGVDRVLNHEPVLVTPGNFAVQERLAHWGAAVAMWQEHPWIGIGAGQFEGQFRAFTPTWRFRISRGHAHSAYLQAAAQAGSIGLVTYLSLLAGAWWLAIRRLRTARTAATAAGALAALAVTAAVAIHGFFEYLHVLSLGIVLSTVWAVPEVANAEDETVTDVNI